MAAVDAVVFDLDDTLVDWSSSIHRTVAEVAGEDLADRLLAWAELHVWVRRDGVVVARDTWRLAEFAEQTWPLALPELEADERSRLLARFRSELWVSFFPDVVPSLDELVESHRLALLSNNPYLRNEVERLRLHDWFELAVDLPRDQTKPDPRAFARALDALGTTSERTVYVGDSVLYDAEGALGAGWQAVWLDRHDDGWDVPDGVHRITSLRALPELLDDLA